MDYTFSIGTDDPYGFAAADDGAAVSRAVSYARQQDADALRSRPERVVVLLGPNGLVTRPSERLDEFVARVADGCSASEAGALQPGDTNAPDCNSD